HPPSPPLFPYTTLFRSPPRRWRLLGRLDKSWRGRRTRDGGVKTARIEPAGLLLYGGWPYLRLPSGQYRLVVAASTGLPRWPDKRSEEHTSELQSRENIV